MKAINLFILTLVVISASGAGWAQQQPELSGFLDDYPQLTPAEDENGMLLWKAPDIEAKYVAAILDQPEIFIHPDSPYKGINPDELKLLADSFRETVSIKLALVHPVVEQPQPNAIRLRFALTNVYLKKKKRPWWGWATPVSLAAYTVKGALGQKYSLVEATVEVEAVDNDTGQRLGVAVYQKGQIKGKDVKEEETSWDDLAEAMDELALVGADYFASFWADTGVAK
jgi:hypothetical protein